MQSVQGGKCAVIEAPSSTEKYDVEGAQQSRMMAWGGFIVCSLVNTELAL